MLWYLIFFIMKLVQDKLQCGESPQSRLEGTLIMDHYDLEGVLEWVYCSNVENHHQTL